MRSDLCVILGGVGTVPGSVRNAGQAMTEIVREINPFLVADGFLRNAPFDLLHGVIRFGTKFSPYEEVGPIDKRNKELPFAMEVEMARIQCASIEVIKAEFLKALILSLFSISLEYELPVNGLTAYAESKGFSVSKEKSTG